MPSCASSLFDFGPRGGSRRPRTRTGTGVHSRRTVPALLALVAGVVLGQSNLAHAQRPAVTTRVLVFTGGGFGGEASLGYEGLFSGELGSGELAPTPLAGVRVESVFLRYLALGGQLETTFWRLDSGGRRNPMLDLALTPRVRYPIVLGTRFLVEPYVVVPIGFSLAVWNSSVDVGGLDRANPGLVVGALAGATLLTRSHVGAMIEFGWMHHVAYDQDSGGGRFILTMNQATLRAGVVYAF